MNTKISVFGNPDMGFDNLPFKILPELKKLLPHLDFSVEDPNELALPDDSLKTWVIIDTVQGLDSVRLLQHEDIAKPDYRVAAHDFDLNMHLQLVRKLNKNIGIQIIGIPMSYSESKALEETSTFLSDLV